MPTRFYFPNSMAAPVSPSFTLGGTLWDNTASAVRRGLLTAKSAGESFVDQLITCVVPGPGNTRTYTLFRQHVGPPMAAQTLSGTIQGFLLGTSSTGGSAVTACPLTKVYAVSNDGLTLRGVLWDLTNSGTPGTTPYPVSGASRRLTLNTGTDTITPTVVLAGDRLVIEIGIDLFEGINGVHTSDDVEEYGAPLGTDFTTESQVSGVGWIEFGSTFLIPIVQTLSDTITFTDSIVPIPPPPTVDLFPKTDTFRGGRQVWVHGLPRLVDPTLDTNFAGQVLPAGWTPSTSGTARIQTSFDGTTMTTGSLAGSQARITTTGTYDSFEATLSAIPLEPDLASASEVDCLIFEYFIDSTSFAQIRVKRLAIVDTALLFVDSTIGLLDELFVGGGVLFPSQPLKLQITRYQNFVFLFVNGQMLASTKRFRQRATGTLRATVTNLSAATKVSTRLTDLTIRSQALIGGRLVGAKVDFSERRITATVPAATLAEVGGVDIILYGPWGSTVLSGAFEYTLPAGKGLGGQVSASLTSYDDPVVKD